MVIAHDITKGNRTRDVKINQNISFETMLLAPNTLQGLKGAGFFKPSPIQLYGIPIGKCGFDLLLEAKSGTGKTAVFSIIALEKLDVNKGLQVIILTPTREIAAQICDVLKEIGSSYKNLKIEVVIGGLPFHEDVEKFKKTVHIVVGSPGRLKHLIQNKCINTTAVRLLVLDEADKLMENSFYDDIKYIHTVLPKQKQVIMSSATYSDRARTFINNYMQNANHVCPDSDSILLGIEQKVTFIKYNSNIVRNTQDRFKELLKILAKIQFKQCLVFCNYQARVSEVHKLLKKEKWPSEQLYGQQEQIDRLDALKTLQQYKCRILVCTDLAARGIDASNIDLIVNFEPPYDWHTYLHRIGRAGRFGSYGVAITILSEGKEKESFKNMLNTMESKIKMHHLWTENEFNVDTSLSSTEFCSSSSSSNILPDNLHAESHKKLWGMLSGINEKLDTLESFENLCKSQEDLKNSKIENFAELILSMQNQSSENGKENYSFKHLEIKISSPTNLLTNEKQDSLQKAVSENDRDKTVEELQEYNVKDMFNIKEEKEHNHEKSDLEMKLTHIIPEADKHININNLNLLAFDSNTAAADKPLRTENSYLYSDLPTVFSSTKFKNKTKLQKNIVSTKSYSKNGNNDKQYRNLQSNKYENTIYDLNNDKDELKAIKFYENATNYHGKIHRSQNAPLICSSSDIGVEEKDIQNHHNSHSKIKFSNNKSKVLYKNWYNQLKIRMQWLEQAIYIDELAKL